MAWLDDTLKKIAKPFKEVVEAPYELVTGKGKIGKIGKKIVRAAKDLAPDVVRGIPFVGPLAGDILEGTTAARRAAREQERALAAAQRRARKQSLLAGAPELPMAAPQANMLPLILGGGAALLLVVLLSSRR